jgi:uncharacterized protein (TIGR03083 family)
MDWIPLLDDATRRFAAVLAEGDLAADVPACPDWTLADLGEHLRWTHLWAAHAVTEGDPKGSPEPGPLDRDGLVAGYRAAAHHLIDVLVAAGEDGPAWTFGPEPVAGFWQRRQVHETTVHLLDALASQGRAGEWQIDPALAWDGVAEVAEVFYPRQVRLGRTEPLPGTLLLTATDVGESLAVGDGEATTELSGPASYLLKVLWKRETSDEPLLAAAITP